MVKGKDQPTKAHTGKDQPVKAHTGKKAGTSAVVVPSPTATASKVKTTKASTPVPSCVACGIIISDDVKALQCDRCQSADLWKCADCLNLPPDMYDYLVSDSSCGLRWFCTTCDYHAMKIPTLAKTEDPKSDRLDSLLILIEKLLEKIASFEDKLNDKCNVGVVNQLDTKVKTLEDRFVKHEVDITSKVALLENNISRQLDEKILESGLRCSNGPNTDLQQTVVQEVNRHIEEDKDLEKRKKNIVIYKIPEADTDNVAERNDNDLAFVMELLDSVFHIKPEHNLVERMFRLGRRDNSSTTPRPLLLGFKDLEVKETVMSNLKNLKEGETRFQGISFSHDMSPKQRAAIKKLVDEAKLEHSRTSSDGAENYWFRVVGQGAKMRVIKVRKQN